MLLEFRCERLVSILLRARVRSWSFLTLVGSLGGLVVIWDSRAVNVVEYTVGEFSVSIRIALEEIVGDFPGFMVRFYRGIDNFYGRISRSSSYLWSKMVC